MNITDHKKAVTAARLCFNMSLITKLWLQVVFIWFRCEKKKDVLQEHLERERKQIQTKAEEEQYLKEERDKMALDTYEGWLVGRNEHKQQRFLLLDAFYLIGKWDFFNYKMIFKWKWNKCYTFLLSIPLTLTVTFYFRVLTPVAALQMEFLHASSCLGFLLFSTVKKGSGAEKKKRGKTSTSNNSRQSPPTLESSK